MYTLGFSPESEPDATIYVDDEHQVLRLGSVTVMLIIPTALLGPRLAECLKSLENRVLKVRDESEEGLSLDSIELKGKPGYTMQPSDWIALADLVNCIPSLRLSFEDHFRSSDLPPSFVLSFRQHSFDLHLTFAQDVNPNAFLSLLSQQTTQSHTPPIDPFAIASLDFTFIPVADVPMLLATIPALARLGRTGPEGAYFRGTGRFDMRTEALGKVMALMGENLWLQWVDWGTHVGMVMESEPVERVKAHNRQTLNLRNGTREAALILLTAARTLLCSFPIPSPEPLEPSLLTTLPPDTLSPDPAFLACSSRPTLVSDLQSFSTLIALSSDPSTSNFPILSVPYELLDLILSYLSSGFLSSNQHRLVMNWAEDRSTLGINKVDSRTDFLRKTNCWRWESEVEMVNLGHAHE